jgi:uncharacterized small protein (DUF1192 family)
MSAEASVAWLEDQNAALRAENERLNKSRNKWGQKYNKELLAHRETQEKLRLAVMTDTDYVKAVDEKSGALRAENERLRTALEWYGEQARLAKLIHAEGDLGRHRLAKDGGDRALAALERKPE